MEATGLFEPNRIEVNAVMVNRKGDAILRRTDGQGRNDGDVDSVDHFGADEN